MNIYTSWGPANFKKVLYTQEKLLILYTPSMYNTFVWAAQALASRVFPVPGTPYNSTPERKLMITNGAILFVAVVVPLGGWIPMFSNASLCVIGSTMAFTSCGMWM